MIEVFAFSFGDDYESELDDDEDDEDDDYWSERLKLATIYSG
jgi:hypothetical protein